MKKGYEVLYLTEPVDEYTIQALPEFDGKRFQNVAKEGLGLDDGEKAKERKEALEKEFEPLAKWLKETALKDKVCSMLNCLLGIYVYMVPVRGSWQMPGTPWWVTSNDS